MNYEIAKFWFDIIQTLLIFAVGIQSHLSRKQAATLASIERLEDDLSKQISEQKVSLAKVERDMGHVNLDDIYTKINVINANVNNMSGRFDETKETVRELRISNDKMNVMLGEFKQVSDSLRRLYENELTRGRT